jgi:iron complex transport system ATP-binding protein
VSAPLSLVRVSASYGSRKALADVSASFPAGKVVGLVGPNGAGKTTLLRAALGFVPPSAGVVEVLGLPRAHWSREALARTIAYLPQGAEAHWPVAARRLVALGRLPHGAPLRSLNASDISAVDEALSRCDATAFAARRMDELSAGERARVLLARALATQAPVLLADEPAAHLDPAHQLHLMELLREEAGRGAAIVVTMHDLTLAARFCDGLIVLKDGRAIASGEAQTVLSDAVLAEAFGVAALQLSAGGAQTLPVIPWRRL